MIKILTLFVFLCTQTSYLGYAADSVVKTASKTTVAEMSVEQKIALYDKMLKLEKLYKEVSRNPFDISALSDEEYATLHKNSVEELGYTVEEVKELAECYETYQYMVDKFGARLEILAPESKSVVEERHMPKDRTRESQVRFEVEGQILKEWSDIQIPPILEFQVGDVIRVGPNGGYHPSKIIGRDVIWGKAIYLIERPLDGGLMTTLIVDKDDILTKVNE